MLYNMLTGRHAYYLQAGDVPPGTPQAQQDIVLRQMMLRGVPKLPEGVALSQECMDLLGKLLNPNPDARATLVQIVDDPWFKERLPSGALAINDHYLKLQPPTIQTDEQVKQIVARGMARAKAMREAHFLQAQGVGGQYRVGAPPRPAVPQTAQ
jgi:serine/threonine protein kinase